MNTEQDIIVSDTPRTNALRASIQPDFTREQLEELLLCGLRMLERELDVMVRTNAGHMDELQKAFDHVKLFSAALRKIAFTSPPAYSDLTFREWAKDIARSVIQNP